MVDVGSVADSGGRSPSRRVHVEVERGDGVSDALQVVPGGGVPGAEQHQRARLGARHQPVGGVLWDEDGCETQDGAAVDGLQG